MEKYAFISTVLVVLTLVNCKEINLTENIILPEKDLLTPEIIKYWGYPAETHEVITKDGYYLTLHRIPHGKINSRETAKKRTPVFGKIPEKPVFFLQHGVLCSSSGWVINLPHQSLGFVLADAGYDVWMGNVRGNTYSRKHSFLKVDSAAFWSFSFAEHAQYDLPAMINYVLNATNQEQLYYAGHSQGTMMPLAGLSDDMKLQKKIKMLFLMAPPTTLAHIISPMKYIADYSYEITTIAAIFGIYELLPSMKSFRDLQYIVCTRIPLLCDALIWITAGYDLKHLNNTRLPVYLNHFPAGTSMKNSLHFSQLILAKRFQSYDYGRLGNWLRYSKTTPPEYYISNVNVPTVVIYGTEDWLVSPIDVKWALRHIPMVIEQIEIKGYNHMDFLWATNAHIEIHQKIINIAKNFKS